jgi:hypothetical protein
MGCLLRRKAVIEQQGIVPTPASAIADRRELRDSLLQDLKPCRVCSGPSSVARIANR